MLAKQGVGQLHDCCPPSSLAARGVGKRQRGGAHLDDDPSAEYAYTRGFHWPALSCLALGQVIYFSLLDPLTYESSTAFPYLTASLPACIGPGIIYVIWLKLWPLEQLSSTVPGSVASVGPRVAQPNI